MSIKTQSAQIASLETRVIVNLITGKISVDLGLSTYNDSGSSDTNMLGGKVKIESPYNGLYIKDFSPQYDFPSSAMDTPFSVDIPTAGGMYDYGVYTVTTEVTDADGNKFTQVKSLNICAPDKSNPTKNYNRVGAKLTGQCNKGSLFVNIGTPLPYNGKSAESVEYNTTLEFPTISGRNPFESQSQSFTALLFEGVYRLVGSATSTYSLGDEVYFIVESKINTKKEVFCSIDYCCVYDALSTLNSKLESDCTDEERERTSSLVVESLLYLEQARLAAQCDNDPSYYIKALEELLGCKCGGCGCESSTPLIGDGSSNGGESNGKLKVSNSDASSGFLAEKTEQGFLIKLTKLNSGGAEKLVIAVDEVAFNLALANLAASNIPDLQQVTTKGNATDKSIFGVTEALSEYSEALASTKWVKDQGLPIPFGQEHQNVFLRDGSTNKLMAGDLVVRGKFITNDYELAIAKTDFTSFETIFNTWKRFSHGGKNNPKQNLIPYIPAELSSWSYDSASDAVKSTENSDSYIGFVSPEKYTKFTLTTTLKATSQPSLNDNDVIAVLGYVETDDLVPNNDPATVGTTPMVKNQHTISLIRCRNFQPEFKINGVFCRYGIVYDYLKTTEKLLVNGDSLVWTPSSTNTGTSSDPSGFGNGRNCDVKMVLDGDLFKVYTSQWDDFAGGIINGINKPAGKGEVENELVFDLSSLAETQKFRGGISYGFAAFSQANASFEDALADVGENIIYDLRNGDVWVADKTGTYSVDANRDFFDELGVRRIYHYPKLGNFIFVNGNRAFDVIRPRKRRFTPSGTNDISGQIGEETYDDTYNYRKTAAGWVRSAIYTTF